MAADSNMSYYQASMPSFHHPCMVSFQPGAMDASTGMISASARISHMDLKSPFPCPPGLVLSESMLRFTYVSGSPAQWSAEETEKLNAGLIIYANEPNILKYAKIATMLPRKTIRDVALRCQWIINKESGKELKVDDCFIGNTSKDAKGKMVFPSSPAKGCKASTYELKHLIDENERILRDIARNLEGGMVQENISLFIYVRNNTIKIEKSIHEIYPQQIPWSMRQMPPLPLSLNDELLGSLISHNRNVMNSTTGRRHYSWTKRLPGLPQDDSISSCELPEENQRLWTLLLIIRSKDSLLELKVLVLNQAGGSTNQVIDGFDYTFRSVISEATASAMERYQLFKIEKGQVGIENLAWPGDFILSAIENLSAIDNLRNYMTSSIKDY